ncbi:MAG: hypothetical protein GC136_09935 [Alphaproteobacteria bacterium]|nr:hypothetical protein [Alphaproteobacteria bacterium]
MAKGGSGKKLTDSFGWKASVAVANVVDKHRVAILAFGTGAAFAGLFALQAQMDAASSTQAAHQPPAYEQQ